MPMESDENKKGGDPSAKSEGIVLWLAWLVGDISKNTWFFRWYCDIEALRIGLSLYKKVLEEDGSLFFAAWLCKCWNGGLNSWKSMDVPPNIRHP